MRFKRPQVRYADTPQPATPYQSAAQAWDERIGSARAQAKNWRLMAFGCLTLAVLMAGGLVWRSAQSIVTPYVIEVDNAGQVRAVGEAATPYKPSDAQIAYHLGRFIGLVRSLSIDPIVVRQNWLDAYDYTTDKGAVVLNEYARTNDPFARIGKALAEGMAGIDPEDPATAEIPVIFLTALSNVEDEQRGLDAVGRFRGFHLFRWR